MTTLNVEIDQDICPICQKPNGCEHHQAGKEKNNCWCHQLIIPREIFKLVPDHSINMACICKSCLLKYGAVYRKTPNEDPQ
jgi:hypothetical protein